MIEVFRTNVDYHHDAAMIVAEIQQNYRQYEANFDLSDTDRILRVRSERNDIQATEIIALMNTFGFFAEVLEDIIEQPKTVA